MECTCPSEDPIVCVVRRRGLEDTDWRPEEIEPCECPCHERAEEIREHYWSDDNDE